MRVSEIRVKQIRVNQGLGVASKLFLSGNLVETAVSYDNYSPVENKCVPTYGFTTSSDETLRTKPQQIHFFCPVLRSSVLPPHQVGKNTNRIFHL